MQLSAPTLSLTVDQDTVTIGQAVLATYTADGPVDSITINGQPVTFKGSPKTLVAPGAAGSWPITLAGTGPGGSAQATVPVNVVAAPSNAAQFLRLDTSAQGNWPGTYGGDGLAIANRTPGLPAYAQLAVNSRYTYTWASPTTDQRAPDVDAAGSSRTASCWYDDQPFTAELTLAPGQSHAVALYFLDWDGQLRSLTLEALDGDTGTVLDSRAVSGFGGGTYLVYNVTGHVKFRLTKTAGDNAVLSGVFFGGAVAPPPPPPPPPPQGGDYLVTPYDRIPNFGKTPTIASVAAGNWSSAATWGAGRVPVAGDVVAVLHAVTYDTVSTAVITTVSIEPGGTLDFRTDVSTKLTVVNLLVKEGGTLQAGTAAAPVSANVTAEVVIADVTIDTAADPEQWGHGLIALGTVRAFGATVTGFVRLASEAHAGDTTLTLSGVAAGWKAGDRVELPDSRLATADISPEDGLYTSHREVATVASVSTDGLTVTLTGPLQYDHKGVRDAAGALTFLPHAANLTRSVSIHSANPSGTRGHCVFTNRCYLDVEYTAFGGLGRTTLSLPDATTFDANGAVTHVGINQPGRHAVNLRHLFGPATSPADGYQFKFKGCVVTCPLDPMPFRWGLCLHNASHGLVDSNVIYNWAGAGLMVETGMEVGNTISGNLVTRVTPANTTVMERADNRLNSTPRDFGFEGACYWFRNFRNTFTGNVGSEGRFGCTYYATTFAEVKQPKAAGLDTSVAANVDSFYLCFQSLAGFDTNEFYGGWMCIGLTVWSLGGIDRGNYDPNFPAQTFKDLHCWNVYDKVYYNYFTVNTTFDHYVVRNDWSRMASGLANGVAYYSGDYDQVSPRVLNADVQGCVVGVDVGATSNSTLTVEGGVFKNYVNVSTTVPYHNVTGSLVGPRTTVVRNVAQALLDVPDQPGWAHPRKATIDRSNLPQSDAPNYVARDELLVYGYNAVAGDDFRVYPTDAVASYVLPQTTLLPDGQPSTVGCPEAGLTNAQAMAKYGIAFAGLIAPANATTRSDIVGLIGPIS